MSLTLHSKIEKVLSFVEEFKYFGEVHMVEFFTLGHWENLLSYEIQALLLNKTVSELRSILAGGVVIKHQPSITKIPGQLTNLQEFLEKASAISLKNLDVLSTNESIIGTSSTPYNQPTISAQDPRTFVTTKEYMNRKKAHEIEQMAPLMDILAHVTGCNSVLDIGSGKGYLGTFLSLCYKLNVTGIDISESNSENALIRAEKFKLYWAKFLKNKVPSGTMKDFDIAFDPVTARVSKETQVRDFTKNGDEKSFVICGLHTCGDLCSSVIHMFVNEPRIVGACVVGCCYHHMTETGDFSRGCTVDNLDQGFPSSQFLRHKKVFLGRNNRMVSLQASERRSAQNNSNEPTQSELSLFYRALLSVILRDCYDIDPSDKKRTQVGKVFAKSKSFTHYVRKCLAKLKLDDAAISDEKITAYWEAYQDKIKSLIAFNVLRQVYSPAVEALILLDRLCHLRECRHVRHSFLVRVFDPVESPRCYALVALKR